MKQDFRKIMQSIASYIELVLSAFLVVIIVVLIIRLIGHSIPSVWEGTNDLTYYLEYAMMLAIGVEFVKMLCLHTPGAIIEVLLFAISRQLIVDHASAMETVLGVAALAGLFAVRKYLFCGFDGTDHIFCHGSQSVHDVNRIHGVNVPEDETKLLRDVMKDRLEAKSKRIEEGVCVHYSDCVLRITRMKHGEISRIEIIKL